MPSVTLLDQRSIRAPGARDLTWCPRKQPLVAWWSPEKENVPTSVSVMRLPSRELVRQVRGQQSPCLYPTPHTPPHLACTHLSLRPARQRNLFNVDSCQIIWHPDGAFLAVLAAKAVKKNKKKGGE
jgi:uncharacterized protein with WD repeat